MEKSQANMSGEREPAYPFLLVGKKKKKRCMWAGDSQERGTCPEVETLFGQLLILLLNAFWVF